MSPPPISRSRLVLAAALALVPFLALALRFDFVCDDAYISFRYARNFARGLGLVFNPGVTPPVEGYSEFLWVLLMAIPERLGADPARVSRLFSAACGVVLCLLVARRVLARVPEPRVAPLAAILFLSSLPPLGVWATGGMGTMPFALAVFACHDALFGEPRGPRKGRAVLAACAVVLLRADGAWWVAAIAGTGLGLGLLGKRRELLRPAMVTALAALALFAAHLAWRYATYGELLPNTARVKLGLSLTALERGARYLGLYLLTFPSLAVALLLVLGGWRRARQYGLLPALVPLLATWAYAVIVGGDFMCYGRFLVPSLPFLALLLAAPLAQLEERAGRVAVASLGLALALVSLLPAFDKHLVPEAARAALRFRWNSPDFETEYSQWARMKGQAEEWCDLGVALREHSRPGDSLVYGAIGAVGYFSDLFIYDRNGLVTREVAMRPAAEGRKSPGHDKAVAPEFFTRYSPTYLDAFLFPVDWKLPPGLKRLGLRGPLPTAARHEVHGELGLFVRPLVPDPGSTSERP